MWCEIDPDETIAVAVDSHRLAVYAGPPTGRPTPPTGRSSAMCPRRKPCGTHWALQRRAGPSAFTFIGNIRHWSRLADLHQIKVPVLITVGQYDGQTPPCALEMKLRIAQAEMAVFPNSRHLPFYEDPALYYPVLRASWSGTVWRSVRAVRAIDGGAFSDSLLAERSA